MLYVVDRANRLVEVDAEWDAVASGADEGARVRRADILGLPLDSFLAGDATKMFVRAALDAARLLHGTRSLPYRCDSAQEHRHFEMRISAFTDGRVQVAHRLVSAVPRSSRRHDLQRPVRALAGWRCSQCFAVRLVGSEDWIEVEGYALLAQDVCPRCARRLFEATP